MKKFFIFAMLLVAGTMAFNSCNDKKDEPEAEEQDLKNKIEDLFKGQKFVYNYIDANNHYNRSTFNFGQKEEFEWNIEGFADEARTQRQVQFVDRGTYKLNTSESTIYLNSTDGFYLDGLDTISKGPNRKPETYTYAFSDGVLSMTDSQGNTYKYNKQ